MEVMSDENTLIYTDQAKKTIRNMRIHVNEIASYFGYDSKYYKDASQSLINCFEAIFSLGGIIHSDGDLELYCISDITYGVNFHRNEKFKLVDQEKYTGTWSVNS